jgi:tetrathionate reductase subunit B
MKFNRRTFVKRTAIALSAVTASLPIKLISAAMEKEVKKGMWVKGGEINEYEHTPRPDVKYGMVIDCDKCVGCHLCAVACRQEYDVPKGVWRSWVKEIEKEAGSERKKCFLPRLCNHCEQAPCVSACPVSASYKREDGVVLTDYKKCIGCKYCIVACPYDARFLNPLTKTSDKCTFCDHRLEEGKKPACVEICPRGARIFGDLNDPDSEVSKLIHSKPVRVIKKKLGTKPQVYYINPDKDITPAEYMIEEYSGKKKREEHKEMKIFGWA